jgi:RNA polymerase sigma-70 factor (ECF subfamily)
MTATCINDELFLRMRGELLNFLHHKMGNKDEAADMVQEVYLRWRRQDVSGIGNPRAFLFTVALNLVRDRARQQACVSRHAQAMQVSGENVETLDPARHYGGQRQLENLQHALNTLPESVRHAFLLFRYDGITHAEIARRLGISKKTVERHIQRASEHCLAILAEFRS